MLRRGESRRALVAGMISRAVISIMPTNSMAMRLVCDGVRSLIYDFKDQRPDPMITQTP